MTVSTSPCPIERLCEFSLTVNGGYVKDRPSYIGFYAYADGRYRIHRRGRSHNIDKWLHSFDEVAVIIDKLMSSKDWRLGEMPTSCLIDADDKAAESDDELEKFKIRLKNDKSAKELVQSYQDKQWTRNGGLLMNNSPMLKCPLFAS
jgi:hypothetical protein